MDDRDQLPIRSGAEARARTLVIRCWFERADGDAVWLRGTIRDLSRGRALAFEGLPALLAQLHAVIGDGAPPARLDGSPPPIASR